MTDCTFCDSRVEDHDPVWVREGIDREDAGAFCNYACLTAHVEASGLHDGAACRFDPLGDGPP